MARAQENPDANPTYLDYFGMTRPPFARLSVPSQLFHSDQYSVLAAHLARATEQSDFLLVIRGAEGSGKTTLLNRHILSLDEDVSYATFDETSADGTHFYCGLLRQLGFHEISGKLRELRNIAREFLIHRGMAGDPVLIIIDNAHLVCASVLEQLRWISEITVKDRRVLSVVLAGNSDLPRIMGSPAMRRLKFRRSVDFNIRVYSEQETEDYIRHRLRLSGGADAAKVADGAHPVIYRFTGGIPNSINRLCNAVLTEACSLDTRVVAADLIRSVAESHKILPHVVPLQGMGRRKTDSSISLVVPVQQPEERIIVRDPPTRPAVENPVAGSAVADVDIKELLNQVSQLSGQLAVQTQKTETLSNTVLDNADEIRRLNKALSDKAKALQESEDFAIRLTTDLNTEKSAAKTAATGASKAEARTVELERAKSELQASVKDLTSELKFANQRAAKLDALRESLKKKQDECESLQASVAETKKELRAAKTAMSAAAKTKIEKLEREKSELRDQCDSLRSSAAETKKELRAAKTAMSAAAKTKIEKLEREKSELHDQCDSLRSSAAETKKELRAAKKSKTAADKAEAKTRTKIEKLEREKLEWQDEFDSLQAGAEVLKTLEKSVSRKDARIAELEAELGTYSNADTSNQRESPSARSKHDTSVEQTVDAIAIIEVFREGEIDKVMNLAEFPSRIMLGRGDDCELRLDSKFVSRHHALIFCTGEGVCIEDLNSFNGTVVNSINVSRCDLHADDIVTIGDFQLRPRSAVNNAHV